MKAWYTAAELAGLPGLPGTERNVLQSARRNGWAERPNRGRGGGREYAFEALPPETRQALTARTLAQLAVPAVQPLLPGLPGAAAPPAAGLKDWQTARLEARAGLLAAVDDLAQAVGVGQAIREIVVRARDGALPDHLQRLVPIANARGGQGGKRTLSARTLHRWRAAAQRGGAALAPRASRGADMPPWGAAFLAAYRRPQKPTVAEALRDLARPGALAEGVAPPSYDQARRWLTKLGEVERRRGRLGPRNLKAVKPFTRRDTTGLRPGDVYTADGHTFDAEVAHPFTGKPFRPEITLVLDVATRMAVGWSCTLAESALAVLDALRHAATRHGIPALFYVDRGPGYINALLNAPGAGLLPRLGTQITHALPYNSQAHGLVERAHRTILVGAAKRLPTYMGTAMDSEAKQIAFKRTRADGQGLIPWADFCRLIDASCAAYNERPHRGLERTTASAGRRRHSTPREAWDGHLAQGWAPVLPEDPDSLFRPRVARTVRRGEVSLFGNTYFAHDLAEWHGTEVFVAYDVWDGERVWVHDREGALICSAQAEANKTAYFPLSQIDHARGQREQGRLRRIDAKRREIEDEAAHVTAPPPPTPAEEQAAREHLAVLRPPEVQAPVDTSPGAPRPRFSGDFAERDWGRWCWNNREQLDADERAEFEARLHSVNFRLLIGVPLAEAVG